MRYRLRGWLRLLLGTGLLLLATAGCGGPPRDRVFEGLALNRPWRSLAGNADLVQINSTYFSQRMLSRFGIFVP